MNLRDAVKVCLVDKYSEFSARASRSEFWWFSLFSVLVRLLVFLPGMLRAIGLLMALAMVVPGIAVGVRRLHDVGRSGWWMLALLTVIGLIPLIYWWAKASDPTANTFGQPPVR